ncbi:MAG: asparagine synthase (glutamine-hydrolyzing), partial [Gemmatimonadota bacterium]
MCGISGYLSFGAKPDDWEKQLQAMAQCLAHRGPDDAGYWYDSKAGIGLGHRRLAVLDLSPAGHQPMFSSSGRYIVTYNGELYNFREIRELLEQQGHSFKGSSDTEVLLAAMDEWGFSEALPKFVGMYAFALWDKGRRVLHLVRDRMGEKPLYYGWQGDAFLFGSELKALRAHAQWKGQIDRQALELFLRHSYVPTPYSIYEGIRKLPPGSVLGLTEAQARSRSLPEPRTYWSLKKLAEAGQSYAFQGSENDAIDEFDRLLSHAVQGQMVADVPVGAFLSGGVDSSAVVALMQSHSSRPVKTFTIGFVDPTYNEADYAKKVARHLGTEHTELYVTPKETLEVIPRLPEIYDEPFADHSQIPTFLISQLARREVTVSLSGDGG